MKSRVNTQVNTRSKPKYVVKRANGPLMPPNNLAVAIFGIAEISELIADWVGHNQVINILRGVCKWLSTGLVVYRGYSLIDYLVHCRCHFQSPLWDLCGNFTRIDGRKWKPTCGSGVYMDRIAAKIYESILEYDAAEYASICTLYFEHSFADDVVRRDKWRLFAATTQGHDDRVEMLLGKYLPNEILTRIHDFSRLPHSTEGDKNYIDGINVYYNDLVRSAIVIRHCERQIYYPHNLIPEFIATRDIELDNDTVYAHAIMFHNCMAHRSQHSLQSLDAKRDILYRTLENLALPKQLVQFAKFIKQLKNITHNYDTFTTTCWWKYREMGYPTITHEEFLNLIQ